MSGVSRHLGLTMLGFIGLSGCGEEPQSPTWTGGPELAVAPVLTGYTLEVFCRPGFPPYVVGGPIATTVTNVGGASAFHTPIAVLDPMPADADVIACPETPVYGPSNPMPGVAPMPLAPGDAAGVWAYAGHTGLYRLRLTYGPSFDRPNTDTVYSTWFRLFAVVHVQGHANGGGATTTQAKVLP